MPLICNVNAVITCPHQSGVAKRVPRQFKVNVGGVHEPDHAGHAEPQAVHDDPGARGDGSTNVLFGGLPALLMTSLMTTDCVNPVPNGRPSSSPVKSS